MANIDRRADRALARIEIKALIALSAAFSITMIMTGVAKHRRQHGVLEPVGQMLRLDEEGEAHLWRRPVSASWAAIASSVSALGIGSQFSPGPNQS